MIRRLKMNHPRRRHKDFSIRSRPFWALGSLLVLAGILALPACLYAAIGETRLTAVPATWWDVAWIVGSLMGVGLLARAVTVFSASAVSGLLGHRLGRSVPTRRGHRDLAPKPGPEAPAFEAPRSVGAGASSDSCSADAVSVAALVLVLSARLRAALGPEFRVTGDELGRSIELAYGQDSRRIVIPFGRFRLLSAAEAVCLTCRLVLAGAQHFASDSLGQNWPGGGHEPESPQAARPSVVLRAGMVLLSWRSEAGTVLSLSPIVLSDLLDRKRARCPTGAQRRSVGASGDRSKAHAI